MPKKIKLKAWISMGRRNKDVENISFFNTEADCLRFNRGREWMGEVEIIQKKDKRRGR